MKPYQFLEDQYLAVSLDLAELHLCLARNDLLTLRFDLRFFILGPPYRMIFSDSSWQAFTTNFFGSPGVSRGLLHLILALLIASFNFVLKTYEQDRWELFDAPVEAVASKFRIDLGCNCTDNLYDNVIGFL